jgi:hypothetical protein
MFRESEIKHQVINYIANNQSFEDFEDWLVERTRLDYLDNSREIRELIGEINLLIFDFLDNALNEEALKNSLFSLVMNYSFEPAPLTIGNRLVSKVTSSAAQVLRLDPVRI